MRELIKSTSLWRRQLSIMVYDASNTWTSSWTEIEPHTAITNESVENKEKYSSNLGKRNFGGQVMISIFTRYVFLQRDVKGNWEKWRNDWLMLATIRDDTWNVLNMQHIIPNLKRRDYSDILGSVKRFGNKGWNIFLIGKCKHRAKLFGKCLHT